MADGAFSDGRDLGRWEEVAVAKRRRVDNWWIQRAVRPAKVGGRAMGREVGGGLVGLVSAGEWCFFSLRTEKWKMGQSGNEGGGREGWDCRF